MEIIRLKNMMFYGYHGVEEHEKAWGARFEVDIELHCDLSKAIESDSLRETVNYENIYAVIQQIVTTKKFFLIETLAGNICEHIKADFSNVEKVVCTVRKPHAPIKGVLDTIEVEVSR